MDRSEGSADRPRLVQLGDVPEFWADGIGKIETLDGGARRLYLYRVRRPLDGEGPIEHEVVATILTGATDIMAAIAEIGRDIVLALVN